MMALQLTVIAISDIEKELPVVEVDFVTETCLL